VESRLLFHNSGKPRSTGNRKPFIRVLTETFASMQEALKREKQIMSWKGGAAFKKLIEGT